MYSKTSDTKCTATAPSAIDSQLACNRIVDYLCDQGKTCSFRYSNTSQGLTNAYLLKYIAASTYTKGSCVMRVNAGDFGTSLGTQAKDARQCSSEPSETFPTTAGDCTEYAYGGFTTYSGCTRTVCNWHAGNQICADYKTSFKIGSFQWGLPTSRDIGDLGSWDDSIRRGYDGLNLCDLGSQDQVSLCASLFQNSGTTSCPGHNCKPSQVINDGDNGVAPNVGSLGFGEWYTYRKLDNHYRDHGYSVRCIISE